MTEEQKAVVDAVIRRYSFRGDRNDASYAIATITAVSDTIKPESAVTDSFSTVSLADYHKTIYTVTTDNLVLVTYGKGNEKVQFVLNYNTFDMNVRLEGVNGGEAFRVGAYGFRRINGTTLVAE